MKKSKLHTDEISKLPKCTVGKSREVEVTYCGKVKVPCHWKSSYILWRGYSPMLMEVKLHTVEKSKSHAVGSQVT